LNVGGNLNILGTTTLNNSTLISSLNVLGSTILNNTTAINGKLSLACGIWNNITDNIERMYFAASGPTCICSGGDPATDNLVVYHRGAGTCRLF
jgi:hypothetical protein